MSFVDDVNAILAIIEDSRKEICTIKEGLEKHLSEIERVRSAENGRVRAPITVAESLEKIEIHLARMVELMEKRMPPETGYIEE